MRTGGLAAARLVAGMTIGATVLGALTACGSDGDAKDSSSSKTVSVVASTDVWGDVVKQVAGDLTGRKVRITSIITDPDADPHSYEANARNQLALSQAALVVKNGGGYDDFVPKMLKSAKNDDATVLDAVTISGHTAPAGGELNEHVWYDFPTVVKVADRIADVLSKADVGDASTFKANATAFDGKVRALEQVEATIKGAHDGEAAGITEPVPVYLLEACGLKNITPSDFSEAIEEGSDVPAAVLEQTLAQYSSHQVKVLAYNEQTSGPETEKVLAAAQAAGVSTVPVTETLPHGKDYLTWMRDNVAGIRSALG